MYHRTSSGTICKISFPLCLNNCVLFCQSVRYRLKNLPKQGNVAGLTGLRSAGRKCQPYCAIAKTRTDSMGPLYETSLAYSTGNEIHYVLLCSSIMDSCVQRVFGSQWMMAFQLDETCTNLTRACQKRYHLDAPASERLYETISGKSQLGAVSLANMNRNFETCIVKIWKKIKPAFWNVETSVMGSSCTQLFQVQWRAILFFHYNQGCPYKCRSLPPDRIIYKMELGHFTKFEPAVTAIP